MRINKNNSKNIQFLKIELKIKNEKKFIKINKIKNMQLIKYFFQFIIITLLFFVFKLIGYKKASTFGSFIGSFFGPFFRSKKLIISNISSALPFKNSDEILEIQKKMKNRNMEESYLTIFL